jgi:hypothetical protein
MIGQSGLKERERVPRVRVSGRRRVSPARCGLASSSGEVAAGPGQRRCYNSVQEDEASSEV